MPVFYAIPTADPAKCARCFEKWKGMGYLTAALVDNTEHFKSVQKFANYYIYVSEWRGYAQAVNLLCADIFERHPEVNWVCTGGDDIYPDPDHWADEIAAECTEHFNGTLGVMQPCGDEWMISGQRAAARICGSPWMGREFCRRINGGKGPFWSEYKHFYDDEEMKLVTEKLGILWQRFDLVQHHEHWSRNKGGIAPPYILEKDRAGVPKQSKLLFEHRKGLGFPGSELIP
jgi:hypothetical protein